MSPFFSKKVKAEMRSRKRKKKTTAGAEIDGDADQSHSLKNVNGEKSNGFKRTLDEKHSTNDDDNSQTDEPRSKKSKLDVCTLTIILPSNLTSKEAKKFRKDERRKARAKGVPEENIKFILEGEEREDPNQSSSKDNNESKANKKPKKSFPRINELLSQHAAQKKLEEQIAKRNAINDAVPQSEKEKYVAIDCEMVGIGTSGAKSALARASAVDWDGNVLLDTFVRVPERVTDFRTHVSGVRPKDIHITNENAMNHADVRNEMEKLLHGKILVGHALKNDLSVLMISHPRTDMRDTAKYKPFMRPSGRVGGKMRPRKLRDLVYENLGLRIQRQGEGHCSIEDARATMELFKCVRGRWEKELAKGGSKRGTK
ncbi:hypothetical protein ACHAW6_008699 [Cyclotella cf. meneghiniana]